MLLGKVYLIIMAGFFLDDLTDGNWRAIALANAIPCFLMFIGNIFLIDESARYLIIINKVDDGVIILNTMIKANNY